jgi:hypothetical protein
MRSRDGMITYGAFAVVDVNGICNGTLSLSSHVQVGPCQKVIDFRSVTNAGARRIHWIRGRGDGGIWLGVAGGRHSGGVRALVAIKYLAEGAEGGIR